MHLKTGIRRLGVGSRYWRLGLLAAAVALLPLFLLAACGGNEATPLPTATAVPAPTPEAVAQATEPTATAEPTAAPEPATAPIPTPSAPQATAAPATPVPTAAPSTPAPTAAPQAPVPTAAAQATAAPTPSPTAAPRATAVPATPVPTAAPPTPAPTAAPQATAAPPAPVPTAAPEPAAAPAPTEPPPPPPCEGTRGGDVGNCAPEFAGTQEWINSEPLSLESLGGKVVLIDFWTYSCINCIRTLPFLQTWHERYTDEGLVIVGVHTPEFEFEKVYDNVVQATQDMGVAWPVVQDNEFSVWRSYSNRFWPAKYLIDKDGVIQYRHFGEGRYAETEEQIRKLLENVGAASEALAMPLPEDQRNDATYLGEAQTGRTPELFAGWRFTQVQQRGGIGQIETYTEAAQVSYDGGGNASAVAEFQTPREVMVDHIYFQGPWAVGPESVSHARETDDYSDFVLLAYSARSVNAVLTSESGEPYKVVVKVNNEHLTEENKGEDIIIGDDGESYLMVTSPKAYKIIEHPTWQEGQYLQMFSMSDDFGLYSFTFGTYEDGF